MKTKTKKQSTIIDIFVVLKLCIRIWYIMPGMYVLS